MAAQDPPKKRRSPISRAEGERRLIDAAYQLTIDRPISEVGVREIATLADVNISIRIGLSVSSNGRISQA